VGDGRIYPPPHQLDFGGGFFLVFENLITLSVPVRHLEAELKCLKLIRHVRGLLPLKFGLKKNICF
jgi:hypothetical protein